MYVLKDIYKKREWGLFLVIALHPTYSYSSDTVERLVWVVAQVSQPDNKEFVI